MTQSPTHSPTPTALPSRLFAWLGRALPLALLVGAAPAFAVGNVVISQVYGGGGNTGATIRHDYVEVYNRSGAAVNIGGWSVQYTSGTGTVWQVTPIPAGTVLPAGSYFLVRQAAGAGGSVDISADVTGSIAMGSASGKVALASSTTALAGANPAGTVDLMGYGTANGFEGSGAAPALSNTTAAFRAGGGATDTDNNAADFSVGAPAPRFTGGNAVPGTGAPVAATINAIQGSGATSPLVGQNVVTSGVVTHQVSNGFFIQALAPDADPATSDGLFVFTGSTAFPAVAVGNLVQVTGSVVEFSNGAGTAATPLTQIANPSSVNLLGSGLMPSPVQLSLPLPAGQTFERFEGMLVTITNPMTVQQNFFQGRFGQVTIGAGGRHQTPTNRFRPGASAQALADEQARGRLLLDDSSSLQNPNPIPYLVAATGLPRAGDTVTQLTGVLDFGLATSTTSGAGLYRLQPTLPPVFAASNPRPAAPPAVGGNITVGSMNVLNYFTTFKNGQTVSGETGQTCVAGETAFNSCRGADSIDEFDRQRGKIVRALAGLNADVVGLMEIQNNGSIAAGNLVAALNAVAGAGTYAAIADPAEGTGTDAIKVAMIYKPARLALVGAAASDNDPVNNRPTLAQTFQAANGERFTVFVNHLKSKGSCPSGSGADADQGDGQGCWNATRVNQANQLRNFVAQQLNLRGSPDGLVIGDMNAYGQEDPIFALTSNGFVDQLVRFNPAAYSYIFDGASGRLDHGITTASMSPKVALASTWPINADEAAVRDYNQEFKFPATTCTPGPCPADPFDATTAARSSDHDPVLLGLNIYKNITGTAARDVLPGSAGDDRITGGAGADLITGGAGADLFVYTSVLDGGDTITDFQPNVDKIVLTDLFRSLRRINLASAVASGFVSCQAARSSALISVDSDGSAGPLPARGLALLQGQSCAAVMNAQNFVF